MDMIIYERGGYRLVNRRNEKVFILRDVKFDETELPGLARGGGVVVDREYDLFDSQSWKESEGSTGTCKGKAQAPTISDAVEEGRNSKNVEEKSPPKAKESDKVTLCHLSEKESENKGTNK